MQINYVYDQALSALPQGFVTALNTVASFFDGLIKNPITVTIEIGYGEITQNGQTSQVSSGAMGGPNNGVTLPYATLVSDLRARSTSAIDSQALAALPVSDPTGGAGVFVTVAQEKALGLIAADSAGIDGSVGFQLDGAGGSYYNFGPNRANGSGWDFIGVAEHEISHALGRVSGLYPNSSEWDVIDLYRYANQGSLSHSYGQSGYFSIDGGATRLNTFDALGDPSDWGSNAADDSFNAVSMTGVANLVTATDVTLMDVLGFNVSGSVNVAYFLANQAALDAAAIPIAITDTAANISSAFDALSQDSHVGAITILDAGIPALSLSSAQLTTDYSGLAKITNVVFRGMSGYYYVGHNGPSGVSAALAISGAIVTLWAASRMDLSGSNNVISVAAGCNMSVTGSGDSISASGSDSVWVGGNGAGGTADVVRGSNVVVYALANSNVQVAGSNDVLVISAGSNVGVTGAGDSVYAGSGDGVWIGGNGAGGVADVVSGSNAVVYASANSNVQVAGSNDVILISAGSNVGVTGAGDRVNASAGDGIWIGGNGAGGVADVVNGLNAVVYASAYSNVQVAGSSNVVLVAANSNVGVAGSGNNVSSGAGDGLWIGSGFGNVVSVGTNNVLYDYSTATHINVGGAVGALKIFNFALDTSGVIDLLGGVGGYATAQAAFQAVTSDGAGGSRLNLGSAGYIDLVGDNTLSVANFKIG